MRKRPEVAVIGAAIVDIPLAPVGPEIFDARSTPLRRIAMGAGGDALNEALVLARLGRAPMLVSVVGDDPAGRFVLETLEGAGVDILLRQEYDFDGFCKVTMTLAPTAGAVRLSSAQLDIPLKAKNMKYVCAMGNGMRKNIHRELAQEDGVVWASMEDCQTHPYHHGFRPYIWLGETYKGLAFVCESPANWERVPESSAQELVREGDTAVFRLHLANRPFTLDAPRQYGLGQSHKHLPEMAALCGLEHPPVFCPIVGDFYSGMEVTVPLFGAQLAGSIDDVRAAYAAAYPGPVVHYDAAADENGFLSAGALSGRDDMTVSVYGNAERVLLAARFDNLGKGASGAAIQNMNILLGADETEGLVI